LLLSFGFSHPGFFTAEIAEIAELDTMSPFFGQAGEKAFRL